MTENEMEWREGLEPSLTEQIWLPWKIGPTSVLVKQIFKLDSYSIAVFDFNRLWFENCSKEEFSKKVKKLNPNIEAPSTTLLQHIQDNLGSHPKETVTLKMEYTSDNENRKEKTEMLTISWSSELIGGVPFTWQFKLSQADNQEVCNHFITPLLMMAGEMGRRELELIKLLSKKDAEIEDYKMAGGKVSRKYLQTAVFKEDAFREEMNKSKAFEKNISSRGLSAFVGTAGDLYKEVQMKHIWHSINQGDGDADLTDASSAAGTPASSPTKSVTPQQSPLLKNTSPDGSPAKDTEILRRQALERKLNEERTKLESKKKKKKLF